MPLELCLRKQYLNAALASSNPLLLRLSGASYINFHQYNAKPTCFSETGIIALEAVYMEFSCLLLLSSAYSILCYPIQVYIELVCPSHPKFLNFDEFLLLMDIDR